MLAVIMAGGKGTRLSSIAGDLPKPMVPVLGKPILEYQIESLKKSDVSRVIFIISKNGMSIPAYFGDGTKYDMEFSYIIEDEPLGTAGALYKLKPQKDEDFILLFGDLILDIDWNSLMKFHKDNYALITLYTHPNSHPYDSDLLECDENHVITGFLSKKDPRSFYYKNIANSGVYCISKELIDAFPEKEKMDLEKDVILPLIPSERIYSYQGTEYIRDIGTPDRLKSVTEDIRSGLVERKNRTLKQKCIFLDRDGTLTGPDGYGKGADTLYLLDKSAEAVEKINRSGYLSILVTNQSCIAKGTLSLGDFKESCNKLETLLGEKGSYLDDICYCPHHPNPDTPHPVSEFIMECDCKKPKPGMLIHAAEKHNIDLNESWMIGDSLTDIEAGSRAGCRTILIEDTMYPSNDDTEIKPDYTVRNLELAVEIILGGETHGLYK